MAVSDSFSSERQRRTILRRPPPWEGDGEELLPLLITVWGQWWKVILVATIGLTSALCGLVMLTYRPQYRATALLLLRREPPYIAFQEEAAPSQPDRKFVSTQIELLRDESVLGKVVAQPEIAQLPELARERDPVDWLATEGLKIQPRGDSELLEVACESRDPEAAKSIVNAVTNVYLDLLSQRRFRREAHIRAILQDLKSIRESQVKELRRMIREKQAMIVANDPTMASSGLRDTDVVIADHPLKNAQEKLSKATIEKEVLQAQVKTLQARIDQGVNVPDVLVDRQVDQRPEIQSLISKMNQRRADLDGIEAARVKGTDDPNYQRALAEIQRLEESLEQLRSQVRPRIRAELEAVGNLDRQQQLETLKSELASKSLVVEKLRENYDTLLDELRSSGDQSMQLALDRRELERQQRILDQILERKAQLETEDDAPERVELVREATTPKLPEHRAPWIRLLIAASAGLTLPLGSCMIWERIVRRVTSIDQLKREARMPVVGEVARLPIRETRHMQSPRNSLHYELGLFEESVDSLRTGLMLAHQDEKLQVFAVSSAVSGEGKSSIAAQLAVSLARSSGRPTLLIDGDMRAPDLHSIFEIPRSPGLAEVLAGKLRITECINRDWSRHVHILPAGELTKSPHKLLGSDRFKTLLAWSRRRYRYIVVDTPPILAASESLVMAQAADGTLICAMRSYSREGRVRMTLEKLQSVGIRPLGTVLSGVPTRQYARRYGAYVYSKK